MNKYTREWYENSCDLIKQIKKGKIFDEEEIKKTQEIINAIEELYPQAKIIYLHKKQMQKSFTTEQIDFICEQIGDWYLMMKPLLEGTHNLGHMKEKLKIMICGNE